MDNEILENSYTVKTTGFEGPFGLLLNLVEARKLFINEISLAQVTEDYIRYMNELGGLTPAEVSNFIIVAATLILIKSKSLLPNLHLTSEEVSDINKLEDRLQLYAVYMKLAENVKNMFGKKIIFAPQERKPARPDGRSGGNDTIVFLPDNQITKESMMQFAQDSLIRAPKKVFLPEVEIKKVMSIEAMIDKLTERIQNSLKMNFKEFSGVATTREEKVVVIVGFLAMLELVRGGILNAIQENNFEDIMIEKQVLIINEDFV